jgi:NAD(P)-dependent dehydrogenase (short-subunit alcohol dehydrogenase family)
MPNFCRQSFDKTYAPCSNSGNGDCNRRPAASTMEEAEMGADAGRLKGMRAFITGASSGIGEATARLFATEGARVALVARRQEVLGPIARAIGDRAVALPADVADSQQVKRAVDAAVEAFGGIDIVVNAAGVYSPVALRELTPAVWRELIDINLSGTYYVAREAALRMLDADGGTIINIGSELSHIGMALSSHYCASKAGVLGLTKALAVELAPKIRVNVVCPGPVATPMMEAEMDAYPDPVAARKESFERVPLKRWATAEEVARAILFFAADAPYATGASLALDGGTTAI